jgi:hypothetical protein
LPPGSRFAPAALRRADLFERVAEAEASAATLPHREKYLLLVCGFLRRLLELHLDFIDEVEREL